MRRAAGGLLLCAAQLAAADGAKPHVVFVVGDDIGFADVGFTTASSEVRTPFLDSLAAKGMVLDQYYVQPLCTPSRSAFLSGRYPMHTGLQHGVIGTLDSRALPLSARALPEALAAVGYRTAAVGKWHLGSVNSSVVPTGRGFERYVGYLNGAQDYYLHQMCTGKTCYKDLRNGTARLLADGEYSTELFTEEAIRVVEAHDPATPLFLYLAYQACHSSCVPSPDPSHPAVHPDPNPPPGKYAYDATCGTAWCGNPDATGARAMIQSPDAYQAPYAGIPYDYRRAFAGCVSGMDSGVRNVSQALQRRGMWGSTLIVWTSDNGGRVSAGGSNYPLRGEKASVWEGGTRVGGLAYGPGVAAGVVSRALAHATDWYPTIMALAGGAAPEGGDGYDLSAVLAGRAASSARPEVLYNFDPAAGDLAALRDAEGWKVVVGAGPEPRFPPYNSSTVAQDTFSCTLGAPCLFNVVSDPNEEHDVAAAQPDIVARLLGRLAHYNSTMVLPQSARNNPACVASAKKVVDGHHWLGLCDA